MRTGQVKGFAGVRMKCGFTGQCDSKPAEHIPAVIVLLLMTVGTTGARLIMSKGTIARTPAAAPGVSLLHQPCFVVQCITFEKK